MIACDCYAPCCCSGGEKGKGKIKKTEESTESTEPTGLPYLLSHFLQVFSADISLEMQSKHVLICFVCLRTWQIFVGAVRVSQILKNGHLKASSSAVLRKACVATICKHVIHSYPFVYVHIVSYMLIYAHI